MVEDRLPTPIATHELYEKTLGTPTTKDDIDTFKPKKRCCSLGVSMVVVGALLVVVSIAYSTILPSVVNKAITKTAVVCTDADVHKDSYTDRYGDCDDCVPYYVSLTMFNVTNANEYLNNGAKLQVQEVGPYVYRRREIRVDVKLVNDSNYVSYKTYTYHTFVPTKSCSGCSDSDVVTSWDVGYLNVIASAGGERGFLQSFIKGSPWGTSLTLDQIDALITANGTTMMKWINGLNSNEPKAWKAISGSVLLFLGGGVSGLQGLNLEGLEYNGLLVRRPISQWALGYPSMLTGLALGSNYLLKCNTTDGYNAQCATCSGAACVKIAHECTKCALGAATIAANAIACATVESTYAATYGVAEAKAFVKNTCGLCATTGVCATPLPGIVETSGLDFSTVPPPTAMLNEYIQRTGCDDQTKIGEYIQYNGYRAHPVWAPLDIRRNPTLDEIHAFQQYVAAKPSNVTFVEVTGQDGTGVKPAGTSITGFPHDVEIDQLQIYSSSTMSNATLVNTGDVNDDISGIKLTRFSPPNDAFSTTSANKALGTGSPVDGVQPLAFTSGFLVYLSNPMFIYGDSSLLESVEITLVSGQVASNVEWMENGQLKAEVATRYLTYLDIEPGTGKTMRAFKRLQASYALSQSQYTKNASMADVMWPALKPEVISPAFIGEESAVVTAKLIDEFKSVHGITSTFLPVLIIGVVVGLALVATGMHFRRRDRLTLKSPAAMTP